MTWVYIAIAAVIIIGVIWLMMKKKGSDGESTGSGGEPPSQPTEGSQS
jgi:preprotein translocase subunit SecG